MWIQSLKMNSLKDPGQATDKKDERNGSDGPVGNEKLMVVLWIL